jgi:hypothetical protein
MIAVKRNSVAPLVMEFNNIRQVNGLHHHHQLMEAIGAISNDFQ